jgi:hypothetical protein
MVLGEVVRNPVNQLLREFAFDGLPGSQPQLLVAVPMQRLGACPAVPRHQHQTNRLPQPPITHQRFARLRPVHARQPPVQTRLRCGDGQLAVDATASLRFDKHQPGQICGKVGVVPVRSQTDRRRRPPRPSPRSASPQWSAWRQPPRFRVVSGTMDLSSTTRHTGHFARV